MAVHTKIRKIFDGFDTCVYELSSDIVKQHCFAEIDRLKHIINFYANKACTDLIFKYQLHDTSDQKMPAEKTHKLLIVHGLQKLVPALQSNNFPEYLDKCS